MDAYGIAIRNLCNQMEQEQIAYERDQELAEAWAEDRANDQRQRLIEAAHRFDVLTEQLEEIV